MGAMTLLNFRDKESDAKAGVVLSLDLKLMQVGLEEIDIWRKCDL